MTPVVSHSIGEWVALDGAFQRSTREKTEGYALRLNRAELISYNDYVQRYANDGSKTVEDLDERSIINLNVTMRNDASDAEGYLYMFGMILVPERKNASFGCDTDLLIASQPSMRESGNPGLTVSIRANSEYDLALPYVRKNMNTVYVNGVEVGARYTTAHTDRRFSWILSNLPVRHVIDFEL